LNGAGHTFIAVLPGRIRLSGEMRRLSEQVFYDSLESTAFAPDRAAAYASIAEHEVTIAVGSSTIAVRFSRSTAAAAFAERFGDMLGYGTPSCVAYAVSFQDEAFFWGCPDRVRRWPRAISDELAVFFADSLAMHEYFSRSPDVSLHAAVIAGDRAVAALVGHSTAGKTTTAIAAVRHGFTLYSDERCIVQDGLVVPFLRAVTVREGGRLALLDHSAPDSSIDERLRVLPSRSETAIRPSALFGTRTGGPPRPLVAVFIIAGRDDVAAVTPCSFYEALPTLLQSMASNDTGLGRVTRLAAELRNLPIFRFRLGTPNESARLIERTLNEINSRAER
jgi:hypothetical protein